MSEISALIQGIISKMWYDTNIVQARTADNLEVSVGMSIMLLSTVDSCYYGIFGLEKYSLYT